MVRYSYPPRECRKSQHLTFLHAGNMLENVLVRQTLHCV